MSGETKIFVKWYDLIGWILDRVEKFPKDQRFIFGQRISNLCVDILEDIVRAQYIKEKKQILERANLKIEVLRILLRLCTDRSYISLRQYEYISENINEAGKMVGGWLKQQSAKEE